MLRGFRLSTLVREFRMIRCMRYLLGPMWIFIGLREIFGSTAGFWSGVLSAGCGFDV